MMRYIAVLLVAACTFALAGDVKNVDLTVNGMHCGRCADKVKTALRKMTDVKDVTVNLKRGSARITLASNSVTSTEMLARAVADAGYSASYKDGKEVKTMTATGGEAELKQKDGDHADADCAEGGTSNCCMGKAEKAKEAKREVKRK